MGSVVEISVAGTASRRIAAERGTVRTTVRVERTDAATAVSGAAALQAELLQRARDEVSRGTATRWTADQVTVTTEREWIREGEHRVKHIAIAAVEVRFRDFGALGPWTADAGSADDVVIERTDWSLTTATRTGVEQEVRLAAVTDALARARDYAQALGADDVTVVRLEEPGAAPTRPPTGWQPQARTRAMSASGPSFELAPDRIEVAATVLLTCVTV